MSITALLERLSWIVLQTRPLALTCFQQAIQRNPKWEPRYRSGPKVALAPAIPFKFLDIGTGCYKLGEHVPERHDADNIYHPRHIRDAIPPVNTFHAVVHGRAARWVQDVDEWCLEEAWFEHSIDFDFRVIDPPGYIWGLPVLVPTCPKKLFSQSPRQKYVDIVTDTLHASSSDLITWNTLIMIKLRWIGIIPRQWLEITTQSLDAWKQRDEKSPFLPDNRRGFARVTPVALSKVGIPDTKIHAMDEFPLHGLGLYDDFEPWGQYSGYVWSDWTTRKAQPMHVDPALQAMIDQSLQLPSGVADQTHQGKDSAASNATTESKESELPVCNYEPPFPISSHGVYMDTFADKRSREAPDSTLKPEYKSLKTSGVAVATDEESVVSGACVAVTAEVDHSNSEAPTIRWNVKEKSEVKQIMRRPRHSSPAWKLNVCLEAMKVRPIDLTLLAQATSVQFASAELVEMAANCLDEITKEMEKDESRESHATDEDPTQGQNQCDQSTEADADAQKSESKDVEMDKQQPDAVASGEKTDPKKSCDSTQNQSKDWVDRGKCGTASCGRKT